MLTEQQGQVLVRLARQTIGERLGRAVENPVRPEDLADPVFQEKRGVFVTLNRRGRLRGCIGSLVGAEPIVEGVRRNAINAAFHDHRFAPLSPEEFDDLRVEVSILTEPRPLEYRDGEDLVEKLRPGIDGVIIRDPRGAGATFLPQVWDQLPNPGAFLGHLCRKAGLPESAWQNGDLAVQTYQVIHFEETP